MKVLVACEYSGVVRDAFIREGHDAISCDLLPSESDFGQHIQGDVRPLLQEPWDLVIAHPPCNFLTGYTWGFGNHKKQGAIWWRNFHEAVAFFAECLNANAPKVAVENPAIMHPPARSIFGPPNERLDFAMFGSPYRKRVGLWTRNLPPLIGWTLNPNAQCLVRHRGTPRKDAKKNGLKTISGAALNSKERARFQPEMAAAMAKQWGY